MGYNEIILVVNTASIIILFIMAVILLMATKFRGENGYAAAIIVLPNVPVYIYNMSRMLGWYEISLFLFPVSYSVNTMLMPLLWLFTKRNFDPNFHFRGIYLLHFLPAFISAIIVLSIPNQERMDSIIYETTGDDTWVGDFNAIVLMLQVVIYFSVIFYYLSKKKHYIKKNSSDAEYLQKEWIVTLMILFSVLFVIVLVSYILWPRTDAWLIQILNVIAMSYLVYNSIAHPALSDLEKVLDSKKSLEEEISSNKVTLCCEEDEVQMKDICEQVKAYLINSNAYLRCDLSLAILSKETGISQKLLSRAINGYLNRNFFELINEMRVKEVKRRLLLPENSDYTIDSIYEECGFRSRSTFFLAFKKIEGKSPAQWLNTMKD